VVRSLMRSCSLFFCVFYLIFANSPALAHRPYYTQVEKILLPNGEVGEVRLLNGDGIFAADPVRAVIVSPQGMLLALSPKTRSMAVSCDANHHCLIVDLVNDRAFDLDPNSFRAGAVQPAITSGDRTDDWDLEAEGESWGFAVRKANASELSAANWTLARQAPGAFILFGILGALGGICLVPMRLSIQSRRLRLFGQAAISLGGLLVFVAFAAFTIYMVIVGGGSMEFSLLAFALGATFAWIPTAIVKQRFQKRNG
jgi:hypothetical protein